MSAVCNPEMEAITRIEALELEVRNLRRRVEHAHSQSDKRVLNKQITELKDEIQYLSHRLNK